MRKLMFVMFLVVVLSLGCVVAEIKYEYQDVLGVPSVYSPIEINHSTAQTFTVGTAGDNVFYYMNKVCLYLSKNGTVGTTNLSLVYWDGETNADSINQSIIYSSGIILNTSIPDYPLYNWVCANLTPQIQTELDGEYALYAYPGDDNFGSWEDWPANHTVFWNLKSGDAYEGGRYARYFPLFGDELIWVHESWDTVFRIYGVNETGWRENSQTYNSTTYETSSESFVINLSYHPDEFSATTAAWLVYNGTEYLSTRNSVGSLSIFNRTIDIPLVTEQTNYSFYWKIGLVNATGVNYFNSTINNQTVSNISFAKCGGSTNITTLNFSLWEEQNLSSVTGELDLTAYYWLGGGTVKKDYSYSGNGFHNYSFCIDKHLDYITDTQIDYNSNGKLPRDYYLAEATINNQTSDISLYGLNTTDSTAFLIKFRDDNYILTPDAYVSLQRYYVGENLYRTVEMIKTDENGQGAMHFEAEFENYRFIVEKDGQILLTTSAKKILCIDTPCTVNLLQQGYDDVGWSYVDDVANLVYSLTFNKTTKLFTYEWHDLTGAAQYGRLYVIKTFMGKDDEVICDHILNLPSGILTCNISAEGTGDFKAEAFISRSPEVLASWLHEKISQVPSVMGMEGLLLTLFLLIIMILFGIYLGKVGMMVMMVVSLLTLPLLGFGLFSGGLVAAVIVVAFIIMLLIEKKE